MTWNWQDIVALSIVGAALVYVAYLAYKRLRGRHRSAHRGRTCGGGCFGCQQAAPESPQPLVQIGVKADLHHQD